MDLLGRARQMLQGWGPVEPPRPQSYNVACPGGHRLQGQRTDGYQALRCPTCGEGIFVLPRSPLPDPPAPAPKKPSRSAVRAASAFDEGPIALSDPLPEPAPPGDEAEAEIEWLEPVPESDPAPPTADLPVEFEPELALEPELAEPVGAGTPERHQPMVGPIPSSAPAAAPQARPRKPRPQRPTDPASPRPAPRPATKAAVPSPARPMIEVADRPSLGEWVVGHRHLLIFLGVLVLVVGTISFRIRQRRLQELPMVAEVGRLEGIPALDAGSFDTAHRKLSEAAKAVDGLGGAYEGADAIRQAAKEAEIYVSFVPRTLEEIITEAAREDEKVWQDRFKTLYKGRSYLFDGNVAAGRILARSGLNNNRVGRIDTTGIRILEDAKPLMRESPNVYGARLASCALKDGEWVIGLEPDSVVVMTHWKALEAFGWAVVRNEPAAEDSP